MSHVTGDTEKPAIPDLRGAASVEQLQAMRKRSRALASVYALGVFALAAGMLALIGFVIHGIWKHPDTDSALSDGWALVLPVAIGLIGSFWLSIRSQELWEEHSPIKRELVSAINDIRDSYYIKLFSQSVDEVERYRSEVILMGRDFTPHDLNVLADYRDRVASYSWNLEAWESEQSERQRLYGDEDAADAAAQAVIGRLRNGSK